MPAYCLLSRADDIKAETRICYTVVATASCLQCRLLDVWSCCMTFGAAGSLVAPTVADSVFACWTFSSSIGGTRLVRFCLAAVSPRWLALGPSTCLCAPRGSLSSLCSSSACYSSSLTVRGCATATGLTRMCYCLRVCCTGSGTWFQPCVAVADKPAVADVTQPLHEKASIILPQCTRLWNARPGTNHDAASSQTLRWPDANHQQSQTQALVQHTAALCGLQHHLQVGRVLIALGGVAGITS